MKVNQTFSFSATDVTQQVFSDHMWLAATLLTCVLWCFADQTHMQHDRTFPQQQVCPLPGSALGSLHYGVVGISRTVSFLLYRSPSFLPGPWALQKHQLLRLLYAFPTHRFVESQTADNKHVRCVTSISVVPNLPDM